jgi:hypothetical protein
VFTPFRKPPYTYPYGRSVDETTTGITFSRLAFSYWIDYLGFITEEKLAAIFIKPSLGVSNWPVIYFINKRNQVL